VATIVWLPTALYVTEQVAFPVLVFTVTARQPVKAVPFSVNATVPPSGVGATVAV
jgi:hypothetical protein